MAQSKPTRTGHISLRIPKQIKTRIAKAAVMEGCSLTDFIVGAADRAAIGTIERERIIEVDERNFARIDALLRKPPKPTAALRKLMSRLKH